jgi:hypothetical protein
MENRRFVHWVFGHYLNIAHPDFVGSGVPRALAAV